MIVLRDMAGRNRRILSAIRVTYLPAQFCCAPHLVREREEERGDEAEEEEVGQLQLKPAAVSRREKQQNCAIRHGGQYARS